MIPTVEWAKKYKNRVVRFQHLHKDFLKTKARELANKMVVDVIRDEMERMGVHRKIWESVVVKDVVVENDVINIKIHSEYFAENGFDVAVAREFGTDDHMIRPKGKNNGGAEALSWIQGGKRRFSAGHMVSGLPRLNIIEETIEKTEYELQQELIQEFKKWKKDLFSDLFV